MVDTFEHAEIAPLSELGKWLDTLPIGTVIKPVYKDRNLSFEAALPAHNKGETK